MFGRHFLVQASVLLDGQEVQVRCHWCFMIRQGYTERFVRRFAEALEAGQILGPLELRTDVFGAEYVRADDQGWLEDLQRRGLSPHAWRLAFERQVGPGGALELEK